MRLKADTDVSTALVKQLTSHTHLRLVAVVWLIVRFESSDQKWVVGKGWLILPNRIITAGHIAYDWSMKFGRAVEVKAYNLYSDKHHTIDRNVQFRSMKNTVTPAD